MLTLDVYKRQGKTNDVLTSVFTVAEKGMYNINFSISQEGRFEVEMFDIWLGTMPVSYTHLDVYKRQQPVSFDVF